MLLISLQLTKFVLSIYIRNSVYSVQLYCVELQKHGEQNSSFSARSVSLLQKEQQHSRNSKWNLWCIRRQCDVWSYCSQVIPVFQSWRIRSRRSKAEWMVVCNTLRSYQSPRGWKSSEHYLKYHTRVGNYSHNRISPLEKDRIGESIWRMSLV